MSGAATTAVLFTTHELELMIEAVTNLAVEMDPINGEEAMVREDLLAIEFDLREALERALEEPTPVTVEWDDDTDDWDFAHTEDHFVDIGIQARERMKEQRREEAAFNARREKALKEHDNIISGIFGEFQVAK